MTDYVHYLVRVDHKIPGLVYPREIEERNYYTNGSLFLMGHKSSLPLPRYWIHAVLRDELVTIPLSAVRKGSPFYRAEVRKLGSFLFHAEPLQRPLPYIGRSPALDAHVSLRRLRSWTTRRLETVCHEHNFYFVGYSEMVDSLAEQNRPQ